MNWKLILPFSLFGVAMGVLSIFGMIPPGREGLIWLLIFVFCGYFIGRAAPPRLFRHGLYCGILISAVHFAIQLGLWPTYVANNRETLTGIYDATKGGDPRTITLFFAPLIALITGLAVGFFSWLSCRLLKTGKRN